jgi:hypothetical protein
MSDRSGIETMLYLLDEAFRGAGIEDTNESQALMPNLRSVPDDAWHRLPPGAARSIESIAIHVGACKIMYDDYAFGDARLTWDDSVVLPWRDGEAPRSDAIDWLTNGHERLMEHVRALTDDDLPRDRLANWGEQRPTRWLLSTLLQHDTYHAGETNHIRALLAADDAWRWG